MWAPVAPLRVSKTATISDVGRNEQNRTAYIHVPRCRIPIGACRRCQMYTMRSIQLAVAVCVTGGMLTSAANTTPMSNAVLHSFTQNSPLVLVQGCPRGYNFSYRTGRCYPAYRENYRDDRYGYGGGGYGYYACPPGTNPNPYDGRCVWSGGVRCPPGYNALGGRCVPNY
jgi:hypothetical protein